MIHHFVVMQWLEEGEAPGFSPFDRHVATVTLSVFTGCLLGGRPRTGRERPGSE